MNEDFKKEFKNIFDQVPRLLGHNFIKSVLKSNHPISSYWKNIVASDAQNNIEQRTLCLQQLSSLTSDLSRIKLHKESMFKKFRKAIIDSNDHTFFGLRFEIQIAALLIKKLVIFEKRESPDFSSVYENVEIFIECTSAHTTEEKDKNLKYKVSSSISKKTSLPYANYKTALFISISNIYYNSIKNEKPINYQELVNLLEPIVQNCKFGSVLIFYSFYKTEVKKYHLGYVRIDNSKIEKSLIHFLDKEFKLGKETVLNYLIPRID